ncbi:MAG: hypothetical protein KC964_31340, partial [Candidatus Omnitrophica bacterium]|nr:hypothetical protein [Candidatus Omnitrophota bacterium]
GTSSSKATTDDATTMKLSGVFKRSIKGGQIMRDEYYLSDSTKTPDDFPVPLEEFSVANEHFVEPIVEKHVYHTTEVHHHHYPTQLNQTNVRYESHTSVSTLRGGSGGGRGLGMIVLVMVLAGLYVISFYEDAFEIGAGLGLIIGAGLVYARFK